MDHAAFVIGSSKKVIEHCRRLLQSSGAVEERSRLIRRIEAETEFIAKLRLAADIRHAA